MAEKNKLSIYLIKDEFAGNDSQILKSTQNICVDIDTSCKVYFAPSQNTVPAWTKSFLRGNLGDVPLFVSNARAVVISRVNVGSGITKTFAVALGYGKNMLSDDVIEEDFGLKVVLNTISPTSLRRINKINIGGNQKTSNEQLPLESDIDDFGFDIDRDLIGTLTGHSDDEEFASGMITGSDLLSLTAEVDVTNLDVFLKAVYARYISLDYKSDFGWIDHIRRVKSKHVIEALDVSVIQLISEDSPKVWMAVPEVIEWENISGFRYIGRDLQNDIELPLVKSSFRNELSNVEQLKQKRISAIRADNGEVYCSWTAYRCLYAEVEYKGAAYCLNNGKWFCVDQDFVKSVEAEYRKIPVASFPFLLHQAEYKRESDYTQAFVASNPKHLLCMDTKMIYHGGGQNKVELCDVLTDNGTFIHLKPYSGSATLSHLFNQAVVSAELVMGDAEFRSKANLKIKEQTDANEFLIKSDDKPTVIMAIISKYDEERPPIPFFSKIALKYTVRRLRTYGCEVYLKNIKKAAN